MNIVNYLRDKTRDFFTIERFDIDDMANSHQIKYIVENRQFIKEYFEENNIRELSNEEEYYDLKYVEYVCSFEVFLDELPVEVSEKLNEVLELLKPLKSILSRGNIIKCIMSNYEAIFNLSRNMADMGLTNALLYDIRVNYSGLKNTEIFNYLVSEKTYLVFGQFEEFLDILKKDDNRLLRALMVDNLNNVLRSNFKEICEVVKLLYHRKYTEIACGSGQILYDYLMMRYRQQENILALQSDFKAGYETLYALKMDLAIKLKETIRDIDEQVVKLVKETGHTIEYEFSNKDYVDWMVANKTASPILRYMTITHEIKDEIWVSVIDEFTKKYNKKPRSLIDMFASGNTNEYFKHSRMEDFDIVMNVFSTRLLYWFGNEENTKEFNECLKLVVSSIFEELNYDISYEGVSDNIDDLSLVFGKAIQENETGILLYNKLMYAVSFLEKLLRLINISINDNVYFERNITLVGLLGVGREYNQEILKVLGEDHLRWTRYFLYKDDEKIGLEYRNRMAHLRDIKPNDITLGEFIKIVWLIISTINTIFTNIINTDCLNS